MGFKFFLNMTLYLKIVQSVLILMYKSLHILRAYSIPKKLLFSCWIILNAKNKNLLFSIKSTKKSVLRQAYSFSKLFHTKTNRVSNWEL